MTRHLKERIWIEDALKHIHECEYNKQPPTAESLAGALATDRAQSTQLLAKLESSELLEWGDGKYQLTKDGRKYALHVIRAHRLYETHLAQETGLSEELWHHEAERMEHELSEAEMERLARRLGDPRFDPHGDPIPTSSGDIPPARGKVLVGCPNGWEGRIIHIEDEPESLYAQVVAQGLAPGMRIRVLDGDDKAIKLNAEGRTIQLSRAMALSVMVVELPPTESFDDSLSRLANLAKHECGIVVGLSPACRGADRSRLLDLGLVPGSTIERDMAAPSGTPVAYIVRGASIALRQEQAERIFVRKVESKATASQEDTGA